MWRVPFRLGPEQRRVVRLVAYLIDTTVLARLANATDDQDTVAARAVLEFVTLLTIAAKHVDLRRSGYDNEQLGGSRNDQEPI